MPRNEVAQALGQSAQTTNGRQGFRAGSGTGYRAAQIMRPEGPDTSLSDSLRSFVQAGGATHNAYDSARDVQGKERANEIIRKLPPEERQVARAQGVLLYQDDPYAMRHLNELTGSNAAYELDQEIQNLVMQGKFPNRGDLDEYRATRLQEGAKSFAAMNGIDPEDAAFQRGFNANITKRNAAVVDQFGRRKSEELKFNAEIQAQSIFGSLLSDPNFMRSPEAGIVMARTFSEALTTGLLVDPQTAVRVLKNTLQDATGRDGGVALLSNIGDQKISIGGELVPIVDVAGADLMENLKARAAHFEQSTKAERAEKFHGQLSEIMANTDTNAALAALDKLHAQTVGATPTDVMTPERQAILGSREQLLNRQRTETAKLQTEAIKIRQKQVRMEMLRDAWRRKLNGEMVSVNPSLMPTNDTTGTWSPAEDAADIANILMNEVASMQLPESEKTNLMLQYVKADRKDGPFRKIMGEFVDQAAAEWQGAVISGDTQRDYPQLNRLRELSKADPVSIAMLFPEKADLVAKLNAMQRYGVDMATAVVAEGIDKKLTQEERNQQTRSFTAMLRKSKSAAQYMPADMNEMARTIYTASVALSNNEGFAKDAVESFVKANTAQFKTSGEPIGTVFKTDILMDPNDITSWKTGQAAVQAKLDAFSQAHPDAATGGAFVASRNGQLYIQTLTGRVEPLYMQDIRDEHARKVAQELEDAKRREQEEIKRAQQPVTLDSRLGELSADIAETKDLPQRIRTKRDK